MGVRRRAHLDGTRRLIPLPFSPCQSKIMSNIVEVQGQRYSIGRLDVFVQMHIARRVGTVINEIEAAKYEMYQDGTLAELIEGEDPVLRASRIMHGMVKAGWRAMGAMAQDDADYVMFECLKVVQREQQGGDWAKVVTGKQALFADMTGQVLMRLVVEVCKENLADFFPLLSGMQDSSESADTSSAMGA